MLHSNKQTKPTRQQFRQQNKGRVKNLNKNCHMGLFSARSSFPGESHGGEKHAAMYYCEQDTNTHIFTSTS